MKKLFLSAAGALALTACNFGTDEVAMLENSIRESAQDQGYTVKQINLRKEGDDRVVGDATVTQRDNPSAEIRWDCTATRQGTSFQWRCAPAAQQASATNNATPTPAPTPAPAPAPVAANSGAGRAAYVGRWTDTNDCSVVTLLGADGVFIAPNGARGNWDVQGSTLTLSGPGGQVSWQVFLNDPNTMTLTSPDGSQSQSTRC